jgi:uncharacterized protein YjbJ (UPF0337 family)
MTLDKEKIVTQEELDEPAPIDQVEERVEAKMKQIEGDAKKSVGEGLEDQELKREGERLRQEGAQQLEDAKDTDGV